MKHNKPFYNIYSDKRMWQYCNEEWRCGDWEDYNNATNLFICLKYYKKCYSCWDFFKRLPRLIKRWRIEHIKYIPPQYSNSWATSIYNSKSGICGYASVSWKSNKSFIRDWQK